jgi:hypothetical protein
MARVVVLGHKYSKLAKSDETLYAQVLLCVSLEVNAGAVPKPTMVQEWTSPKCKTAAQ